MNIATFFGIAILAVPTLSLNKRKKSLQQANGILDRALQRTADDPFNEVISEVQEARGTLAGQWRRIDEICLFIGYFLLLGSSFARIYT
ncbi:MAG: hypothetical protein V7775_20480 [Sulfitobacter sp.]